jgi:hypothetical protein
MNEADQLDPHQSGRGGFQGFGGQSRARYPGVDGRIYPLDPRTEGLNSVKCALTECHRNVGFSQSIENMERETGIGPATNSLED